MTIIFEPKYSIGDVVCLRIDIETKYMISHYELHQVSAAGEVIYFRYAMYDKEGQTAYYPDIDLQLIEKFKES